MRSPLLFIFAVIVLSYGCQQPNEEQHKIMDAYAQKECHAMWPLSEELLGRSRSDADFLYYKGLCEHQMGHHTQAITDLKSALTDGVKFKYGIYLNLASSYAAPW